MVGAGPPGAYNIAGDGVLTAADVAREFGALPLPVPAGAGAAGGAGGVAAAVPAAGRPSGSRRSTRPAIMDTARAKRELGWQPRYTGLEALRDTLQEPGR